MNPAASGRPPSSSGSSTPAHPALDHHVAAAAARRTGRGWRLVKADDRNIDAVIALAMACERAQVETPVAPLLGWV